MENNNTYIPDENVTVDDISLPEVPDLPDVDDIKMPDAVETLDECVSCEVDMPSIDSIEVPDSADIPCDHALPADAVVHTAPPAAPAAPQPSQPRMIPGTNIPAGRQTLMTESAKQYYVPQTPAAAPVQTAPVPAPAPTVEQPQYQQVPTAAPPAGQPTYREIPVAAPPAGQQVSTYQPIPQAAAFSADQNTSSRSKVAAAILAFLLGFVGIHNFYLGNTVKGFIQLAITACTCFCGFPISWLWAVIEGFMILFGNINTDVDGKFLK